MNATAPRLVASLVALAVVACKTPETKKPAPAPVTEAAEAPTPSPPPARKVELPPARALSQPLPGLVEPRAPDGDPVTAEKAELGWTLFFDPRLSKDGSMACAQCHHLDKAYTSGNVVDVKVGGAVNKRNSPTVVGLGVHPAFYWDGRMPTLEAVSAAAWKGQLGADPGSVSKALNAVPVYEAMFVRAFGEPATAENVPRALASFFRALNTGASAWDRAQAGDAAAMSKDAKAGEALFLKGGCAGCHAPPLFSDLGFHSLGLGDDAGRFDATKDEADRGKFKTPSLRNVALTAPYFHDGSAKTLDEAIALMARGGAASPPKDPKLKPVKWSPAQAAQVRAFLEALTGELTFPSAPGLP
ncbi:MAG: c-type cytochrome [Myxococcaceae bacterium]|jgi:cytochrome c peroxidase|nr:c-type cytochrome [Myxococcaceae bacterium]MCA3016437.1 c-type cytochrome [Myxococcaceae bacterium]